MNADLPILFTSIIPPASTDWGPSPQRPPSIAEGIHLWQVPLLCSEVSRFADLERTLSDQERERARRFRHEQHRHRYVMGRASMRNILGRYLSIDPRSIVFTDGKWGKPLLPADASLHFNFTRCEDLGLLAVRRAGPVGIDLEHLDRIVDHLAIAKELFTPQEEQQVSTAEPSARALAFFQVWTRYEARLKAVGIGLAATEGKLENPAIRDARCVGEFLIESRFVAAIAVVNPVS